MNAKQEWPNPNVGEPQPIEIATQADFNALSEEEKAALRSRPGGYVIEENIKEHLIDEEEAMFRDYMRGES